MPEVEYQDQGKHPSRPALYINVTNPDKVIPFIKDERAPIDTGAPYTALPSKYRVLSDLKIFDYISLKHGLYIMGKCPLYLATVTAEESSPQMVAVLFLDTIDTPIIGRNLLEYWHTTLIGPERKLVIVEP